MTIGLRMKTHSECIQEIEPDDNVRTCQLKQAHNAKVKQCLFHDV